MVPGDHRVQIAALDNVLVGRGGQLLHDRIGRRSEFQNLVSAFDFLGAHGSRFGRLMPLKRRDHHRAVSGELQQEGTEQILPEIQAALFFAGVFEVIKPVAGRFRVSAVMGEMQRRQALIGADGRLPVFHFHRPVHRIVVMRGPMIIAESDQRAHFERTFMPVRVDFILDHRGVLPVRHKHALFDFDSVDVINRCCERVQPEFLQVSVPVRIHRARILVHRQIIAAAVDNQRLFELRQQQEPADRRLRRRSQQAMVPARIHARDGRGSEASQTVGFDPLQLFGTAQISADNLVKSDHNLPSIITRVIIAHFEGLVQPEMVK